MSTNLSIAGPLGGSTATPVPRSFTAYGPYGYPAALSRSSAPARKIICRMLRTDTDPATEICKVDPCDDTACDNSRWTAGIVVPNDVPFNTLCRLKVEMWVDGASIDSESTQYLELKADAPAVVVPACPTTSDTDAAS